MNRTYQGIRGPSLLKLWRESWKSVWCFVTRYHSLTKWTTLSSTTSVTGWSHFSISKGRRYAFLPSLALRRRTHYHCHCHCKPCAGMLEVWNSTSYCVRISDNNLRIIFWKRFAPNVNTEVPFWVLSNYSELAEGFWCNAYVFCDRTPVRAVFSWLADRFPSFDPSW